MIDIMSIFYFIILIASIIVHEVAHGLMAEREGDPTARLLGRITLNPLKHIDIFGSIILPAILVFSSSGVVVGWAKPVPYDPRNLKNGRKSEAKVAVAGIITNLIIAAFFGLVIRTMFYTGFIIKPVVDIGSIIILVNVVLAIFNSIPIAPLDGFRFISSVLPYRFTPFLRKLEQYSLPLLVLFVIFIWKYVAPIVYGAYSLLTGINI